MDLLERYLAAIARHLPEGQKADVTAELRDVLLSQVEEEEERLGRPLIREEMEALLVRFGHPLTVSGRYRRVQHLIGPEVFPFWWAAIKVVLGVIFGVWAVAALFLVVAGPDVAPGLHAPPLIPIMVFAFGAITLICALIEQFGKTAILQTWRPSRLPPPHGKGKSTFERVLEIGLGVIFILWWMGLIRFRHLIPDYGMDISMGPIWAEMYWPILAYGLFELGMNVTALLRPDLMVFNRVFSLARNLFGIAILGVVLQGDRWLVVAWDVWTAPIQARVQDNFDMGMRIGLVSAILIFVALACVDAWRLWQARQARRGTTAARPA